jgi:hypothetical protein
MLSELPKITEWGSPSKITNRSDDKGHSLLKWSERLEIRTGRLGNTPPTVCKDPKQSATGAEKRRKTGHHCRNLGHEEGDLL